MLKDFAWAGVKLARNPLGIIGLAFVLVYGIAGVVATSNVFQADERRILVYFLVLFPVLILGTFYKLVTCHHTKLYAPSDFKEDAGFLQSLDARISTSPKILELEDLTEKIQEEIHNQPLYRYTKLSECGKQLILGIHRKNKMAIADFLGRMSFQQEEFDAQVALLKGFKWIELQNDELVLTPRGRTELDTFVDLAYGRLA